MYIEKSILYYNYSNHTCYTLPRPFHSISDIEECDDNLDNCAEDNAECTNTIGSFTCTCDPGYSGDGTECMGE